MLLCVLVAMSLAQVADPDDHISDHVISNIRNAVRSATSAATVTVTGSDAKNVQLHVEEAVVGQLSGELTVPATPFYKRDLEPGTRLLVFFRGQGPSLAATGHYELVSGEMIREYPADTYVSRVKFEQDRGHVASAKAPAKTSTTAAAPVHTPGT